MADLVQHRYEPRGACLALWHDRSPELLVSGPAGTGKSRACLEKVHAVMLANPGARALIVRKTQVSMTSTALVTFREFVLSEAIAAGLVKWFGGSQQEAAGYRYRNGSRVTVGGMDRPTKVMSSEYDIIYVQEAIELTVDDWEALTTRLRHGRVSFQQLIADTNPDSDMHWLHQRVVEGSTQMLQSVHSDNPVLIHPDGSRTEQGHAYLGRLDRLTGVRRQRLLEGLWVAAEGIIYDEWNPVVHLVDQAPIPMDWPRWWAVDFGYVNPFVLQRWALSPDGQLVLYAERYRTRQIVEDHARAVLREVTDSTGAWVEPRPVAIVCDHDAEDRATLERHLGISTSPANKAVSEGIQAVAERLRVVEATGQPRLVIMRDAVTERDDDLVDARKPTSTAEEIPGYVWATPAPGKPPKDEPLKMDDHGADAMRYLVAEVDLGARPRVRWLG